MKVLVTGGNGFIGSLLIEKLVFNGHSVRSLTREIKKKSSQDIEFVQADLILEHEFSHIVAGCDAVINCAGEIRDITKMHSLHVDATRKLLQAFKESAERGGVVKHWIQLSSVGAYGPVQKPGTSRVITEESPENPQGEYEVTKTLADHLIMSMADENLTYSILRPSNVVGTTMPNQSFPSLIKWIKKKLFFYIGSRDSISTYVHVDDVTSALLVCLENRNAINQIFNLSNDCKLINIVTRIAQAHSISANYFCFPEFALRMIAKTMAKTRRWPLTECRIDALVSKTTYPVKKIERLGFKPKVSIPDFAVEYSELLKRVEAD
jgi:nucleoside-diphosphate-sugar epimerase